MVHDFVHPQYQVLFDLWSAHARHVSAGRLHAFLHTTLAHFHLCGDGK